MILIFSLKTTFYLIEIENTIFAQNADCLLKNPDKSKSKEIKFQVSQLTHDVVSTSIRRLYDVGDWALAESLRALDSEQFYPPPPPPPIAKGTQNK